MKNSLKMAKSKAKSKSKAVAKVKSASTKNSKSAVVDVQGQNMGSVDKVVRVCIAVLISALVMLGWIEGWVAIVAVVFAVYMLVNAITGVCGIYSLLGINTCEVRK